MDLQSKSRVLWRGGASKNIFDVLLIGLLLWPYAFSPNNITAVFCLFVAVSGILLGLVRKFPAMSLLWVFIGATILQSIISYNPSENWAFYLSQVNHFWQFPVLFLGFSSIVLNSNFYEVLSNKIVVSLAGAIWIASVFNALATRGYVQEYDITVFVLIIYCFLSSHWNRRESIGILVLVSVTCMLTMPRSSSALIILLLWFVYFFQIPGKLIKVMCVVIILTPIFFVALLDLGQLRELLYFDHNSYIRIEFLRGGLPILYDNFLFGAGFSTPYREINFHYLSDHALISRVTDVNIISNHHSVFDISLRLGIFAAISFVYTLFLRPNITAQDKMKKGFLLILAVGVSVNAWFENQTQLPMLCFLASICLFANLESVRQRLIPFIRYKNGN